MGDARVDLGLVIVSEWSVRSVRACFPTSSAESEKGDRSGVGGGRRMVLRCGVKKRDG